MAWRRSVVEIESERDALRAEHAAVTRALRRVRGIVSVQDIYSGISPREFVRTEVCGISLGGESNAAMNEARAALSLPLAKEVPDA